MFLHCFFLVFVAICDIALADMCEDLCLSPMNPSGCPKGSWCKNNYDCHGLFWTSADRLSVCVLDGPAPCTDRFPVLCNEAEAAMRLGTVPTPPVGHDDQEQQLSFLDLHFALPSEYNSNPFVRVSYVFEGRNLGYWALFDSAAWESYVMLEPLLTSTGERLRFTEPSNEGSNDNEPIWRRAAPQEGYFLRSGSATPTNPGTLTFGIIGREFTHSGTISERIRLFTGNQTFEFDDDHLTLVPPPGDGYRALLGTSYNSAFARSAGSFALVPGLTNFNKYRMVVGRGASEFVEQFCASETPLTWYPLSCPHTWSIVGTMTLSGNHPSVPVDIRRGVELYFDTGAGKFLFVTPEILNRVREILLSLGAERLLTSDSAREYYRNCSSSITQFLPTVSIRLNGGGSYVNEFLFMPSDYIEAYDRHSECELHLRNGEVDRPNKILVSNQIISAGVSVFDHDNARFGFCVKNTARIDEYLERS